MESVRRCLVLFSVGIFLSCVFGLQRPPPRYSQQYMPETSFSCRNKIVGSYYADPETDCQVFHVCVSVAGSIQDYKFLCPNDTAFDQESQTCADWYDVDCEAATLYYASDNFDLYRIGSGLESPHYDNLRADAETQDNLLRSESNDPVRSSANNVNRLTQSTSNYNANGGSSRDILRGSSSSNFYNRNGKEEDYDSGKYKDEPVPEPKKKTREGVRKVARKQQYSGENSNSYSAASSTAAPLNNAQNSYTGNYYSGNSYNQRQTSYASSTTARPVSADNYNARNQNGQRYTAAPSTYRPSTNYNNNNQDTYSSYPSPSTTSRTTVYNTYKANNYNQQQSSGNTYTQSTTLRPTSFNNNAKNYPNYNNGQYSQSTTVQPSTNYQSSEYTNHQQRNYNNIQRGSSNVAYQSTTPSSTNYDNNYSNHNLNNGQYRSAGTSARQEVAQTTAKYFVSYAGSSYAPTTYSPPTKKFVSSDSSVAQSALRSSDSGQYYDKNGQTSKQSTQYYDSTKAPKKATQYNTYESSNSKYYIESSTGSFDLARSPAGIGFSPASINHLAETPRPTTPVPRRANSATTYNPANFNSNTQRPSQPSTTPRGSTYVSGSARPFSSTTVYASSTTARPKTGKKNDYDYAYYDNAGALEYDGLDLEHVPGNKESSKIARN